jgi:ABC-2 type transport system permease protein
LKDRNASFALILSSIREKRTTILAWAISGALAMYFEALAIAAELRDYPGGPEALAKSIYPTIEGMRIIRWPADRLDTLGGYLAYHNIVLFNFFLAIFAAIQGARLIRYLEENRTIEFISATGLSRRKIISLRSCSYLLSQLLISLSLGIQRVRLLLYWPVEFASFHSLVWGFSFHSLSILQKQHLESLR